MCSTRSERCSRTGEWRWWAGVLLGLSAIANAQPQMGQIVVDPDHPAWFKYEGGGPFYMCGPGDPEDFLYRGTRNPDGTRNGDQFDLIDKLTGTGANCIYLMAIRSHGGDGNASHNPYVDSDLTKGLDNDILNQWESWFTAMDKAGITIFFFFYDDSAKPFGKELPAGGELSPQEAAFIDAMVARFKHHRRLIWCVAEEYAEGLTRDHAIRIAERIQQQDDRRHPVAIHQNNGTSFDFNGVAAFNQFAVQWNVATAAKLHAGTLAAWNSVGGQVNVNMSEFQPMPTGDDLRNKVWSIALGGGYAMILFMDIASTPVEDLRTCGRLVRFMEATRFNEAAPHDELARGATDYVLADPGRVYLAYGDAGSSFGLVMQPGYYSVNWYDPVTGTWLNEGVRVAPAVGEQSFTKPAAFAQDAALYVVASPPASAADPSPPDTSYGVGVNTTLTWTAGAGTASHAVHFGISPPGEPKGTQTETLFHPGPLIPRTTYYWRIDEINPNGTTAGAVWCFTTKGIPGDMDEDNDVDQADFGRFQACFSGGGAPEVSVACRPADLNADALVDRQDFEMFLRCLSGPNVPGNITCDGR